MIAILGASGFIGKNLILFLEKSFSLRSVSLRESDWNIKLLDVETVVNLVGKAHDHKNEATEKDFYFANYEIVKEIYDAFINSPAKLLIHISSLAAVEEFQSEEPLGEDNSCNPQSFYGKSKRAAEEFLLGQKLPEGKKVVILRPTMVHGPGDKGNLTLLYKLISKGLPYPLSRFNNKRSFVSVSNFNFIVQEIIEKQSTIDSGIYHVCDDDPIATSEIIKIIGNVTNKREINLALPKAMVLILAKVGDKIPFPLNTKRLRKMTSNLIVSNQKIKKALGIKMLPVSAEEGIIITIKSFIK